MKLTTVIALLLFSSTAAHHHNNHRQGHRQALEVNDPYLNKDETDENHQISYMNLNTAITARAAAKKGSGVRARWAELPQCG